MLTNAPYDDLNQKGGAVAWTAIALMFWVIGAAVIFSGDDRMRPRQR